MIFAADLYGEDEFDRMVGAIIEAGGGDARAAILDLVRRHHELGDAVDYCASAGYVRPLLSL